MVKFEGAGKQTKSPNLAGQQRAHEGLMQSMESGTQQANRMGQQVQGAVENVQQQGQQDAEMQMRKDRLAAEMAKGGLEFTGEGTDRKIQATEASQRAGEREMRVKESRAATEAQRAAAYELSQQVALVKSGYTEGGELNEAGRTAIKNLGRDYKKQQKLFERLNRGDPAAIQEAQSALPDVPEAQVDTEGVQQMQGGLPDQGPMGMTGRLLANVRAGIDHSQLKFVVNSKGEMPEDVMDDSLAWQAFHGWKQNVSAMMKSGRMMVPPFRSIKDRNRFLNEAAARMVLSGRPAPGSMADPQVAQGMVPAQAPAGQPDGGQQPGQSALGDVAVDQSATNPAAGPLPQPGGWGQQQ